MKVVHREDKTAGAKKPQTVSTKKVIKKTAPMEEAPVKEDDPVEAEEEPKGEGAEE